MLPGWASDNEPGYTYGPEYALPGSIMVDSTGSRFCDDSYYIDIIRKAVAPGSPHLPAYMIWDDEHRKRYGLGKTLPGGEYPPGQVTTAATLEELGAALDIDGDGLAGAVARYNEHAVRGEDPEFGRGTVPFVRSYAGDPSHELNPLVGPLAEGPFHGMRLVIVGTGIGSSGVHIDGDAHVLNADGAVLPGLHAIGACAALTSSGSGYNSGFALGRGLTHAYLVARELAGDPVARESAALKS
jgi:3-oxosteroid 1-dehydrogenase